MLSKLQFLLKSTNQHGVHSPFVFNYITKGLYQNKKKSFKTNKTHQWLLQSIHYFKPNTISFLDNELLIIVAEVYANKSATLTTADLIVARYTTENGTRIMQTIKKMSNSQLLLIASYSYSKSFFNELRNNSEITLVVDCYYGCLISKRTEQPKQNFFIRY